MSTCMHAQQYAEKMIKEKYVELFDSEPDRTHNLKNNVTDRKVAYFGKRRIRSEARLHQVFSDRYFETV